LRKRFKRKAVLPFLAILLGVALLGGGFLLERGERKVRDEVSLYNEGCRAAESGDVEKAVEAFYKVALYANADELQARALYNLATIGWAIKEDPAVVIRLYQDSLEENPEFDEAAFNLELLYDLLQKMGGEGAGSGKGGEEEGGATSGDI